VAVIKAKPEKIVDFFLAMVERELITPLVVTRVAQDFFTGAKNDTVSLRISGLRAVAREYEFRSRTAPIVLDDIQGGETIDVKLDTHVVSATGLTDEHFTLDNIDFATEVLNPQVAAVTDNYEARVAAALRAETFADNAVAITADSDPLLVGVEARRLMDAHKVAPRAGRVFLIGSDVEAAWLASDRLSKYDSTGQTGTPALREAIIGRLAGSPVVSSTALNADECYYLHKTAFVLGNVAPRVPKGATLGRSGISRNGFAVRWIMDYDADYLEDRSIVSSFLGINGVKDERQLTGEFAGNLLDETDPDFGVNNVRGVRFAFTGGGSVLP
jgi:hypothetical protein